MTTRSRFNPPTTHDLAAAGRRPTNTRSDPADVDTAALLAEVRQLRALLALVLDGLNTAVLACFPHDEPISFLLTERATCALACEGSRDD